MKILSKNSKCNGFSLVEVMVATVIFAFMGLSATSVFLQNNRMVTMLRYRTHATNAALSILEQIRLNDFTAIKGYHDTAASTILVGLSDPMYTGAAEGFPAGFRPIHLSINVLDGAIKVATPTSVQLVIDDSTKSPKLQAQFWTTIKANISTSVEVYEIAIMYQWKNPAAKESDRWQSSTIRMTMPNPNPRA